MGLWCIDCSTGNRNDFDTEKNICKRCNSTNIVDISESMKIVDILTITAFSKDKRLLKAMSDLYENNIIELFPPDRLCGFREDCEPLCWLRA